MQNWFTIALKLHYSVTANDFRYIVVGITRSIYCHFEVDYSVILFKKLFKEVST